MIREMKLGVFLEPQELVRMASEEGIALDVEDADVIKLSTAPTALKEASEASPEK